MPPFPKPSFTYNYQLDAQIQRSPPLKGTKMSETSQSETFTERVGVTTQPDRALIGTLEIEVPPVTTRDVDHQEEINALRDRIAELERMLAERVWTARARGLPEQPPEPAIGRPAGYPPTRVLQ
jgi:hypothetical protein